MSSTAIIITTALISIAISGILAVTMIPLLRKLNFGQTIREDGPTWHSSKQGTPIMGGIIFIGGTVIATLVGYILYTSQNGFSPLSVKLFAGIIMALLFSVIGFIDDYIKAVKKQNLGLTAKQKLLLQVLITIAYLAVIYIFGGKSTIVNVPFLGQYDFGFMYYIIMGVLIIGIVNSANLTDGVDGLLGTVTFIIAIFFILATNVLHLFEINILAIALAGSLVVFLFFNLHPAKVFMGDTGSFFLGGIVVALAFAIDVPLILFFVGFIYCIESLSVILQIISFKTTGKRIFKMSPIHHHFELTGMSENKIVAMFSLITAILCFIAYIAIMQI